MFTKLPNWGTRDKTALSPGLLDSLGTGHQQRHGLHDAAAAAEAAVHGELAPGRKGLMGDLLGEKHEKNGDLWEVHRRLMGSKHMGNW